MACAAAVDKVRSLIAGALPPELQMATVGIGHPGALDEYALALSLFVLQLREDELAPLQPGGARPLVVEAPLLVSSHAPPERGSDGIQLLEVATRVLRGNPNLGQLTAQSTAEVSFAPVTLDEMASLWRGLATPLQPSVLCLLRILTAPAVDLPDPGPLDGPS